MMRGYARRIMNSHSFSPCSRRSLFGHFLAAVTTSLRRSSSTEPIVALAASLASELRAEPGVAELVIKLSSVSRAERHSALFRAAHYFRGEWNTFGIADSLRRLTRPALFQAVIRELQTHTPASELPRFTRNDLLAEAA